MGDIAIDTGNLRSRKPRFPVRLAVAVGKTAEAAEPWGIASDVSSTGLFVRTTQSLPRRRRLRLWFVDRRTLRSVDTRVVRRDSNGVGVSFDDESFYRWAFDRMTNC